MFVFVNRSSTTYFEVGRRLRRGDPLSPFLYVIIAEGLADLVKKASNAEDFKGFSVNGTKVKAFTFLGIPIGSNPRRIKMWKHMMDKVKSIFFDWKWSLLTLEGRYGNITHQSLTGGNRSFGIPKSSSWKDLIMTVKRPASPVFDFAGCLKFFTGDGSFSPFWTTVWWGSSTLKSLFYNLYQVNRKKEGVMDNIGNWSNNKWL
ncbi:hypothetical protein KIW84_010384 [Lathyrus oleraceus]|uniref:Uncharacterized protein n=1 Tax=Pisum sativum TaxID=3888 RepID=A0A9D4YNX5_PEA|nr:hypothetical protein KIW84_010384 [Pisum sativum]